jgi:hypothetical protein
MQIAMQTSAESANQSGGQMQPMLEIESRFQRWHL